MSRIGKKDIIIPEGVEVKLDKDLITVKGPLGELTQTIHELVTVNIDNEAKVIKVTVANENDKTQRAFWGLFARLIENMVIGVSKGFEKQLELNGVGFRVALQGSSLNMSLGFSHPVVFPLPEGIKANVEGNKITVSGIDKQLVGQAAANIRALKKPEPYKGKGLKYVDEVIIRKAGKAGSK